MHLRILLIFAIVAALAIPTCLAAPAPSPATKKTIKVKRPSTGGNDDGVDPDAGSPNMFLDYEPATMTENSQTFTGIWVPNTSGGCLMWSNDRVTPLSFWKPACDAPKLKTWAIGVIAAVGALLLLCCCCCICVVKRTGSGVLALVKGVKSGQGLKALTKTKNEGGAAATHPNVQPAMMASTPAAPTPAYPPQQSMPMPSPSPVAPYPQGMPEPPSASLSAAYPPQSMPMPPASPAAYPQQAMPMPFTPQASAPAQYPPSPQYPPIMSQGQHQQQQQQPMPGAAYPPQ